MDACTNPDVLRVIYFIMKLIDVVRIIVPIGLIVMGTIDLSKSVITSDDKGQKKNLNLFIKRIIYAVLVFAVPWIVKSVMVLFGDLTGGDNFTDCIIHANKKDIARYSK